MRIDHATFGEILVRKNVFTVQLDKIQYLIRSLSYFRYLRRIENEIEIDRRNAKNHIQNVCFINFILEWCKLFSSESDKIHIMKLFIGGRNASFKSIHEYKNAVWEFIERKIEITPDVRKDHVSEIRWARNSLAAHSDLEFRWPLPRFDAALNIIFAYNSFLMEFNADTLLENEIIVQDVEYIFEDFEDEIAAFAYAAHAHLRI